MGGLHSPYSSIATPLILAIKKTLNPNKTGSLKYLFYFIYLLFFLFKVLILYKKSFLNNKTHLFLTPHPTIHVEKPLQCRHCIVGFPALEKWLKRLTLGKTRHQLKFQTELRRFSGSLKERGFVSNSLSISTLIRNRTDCRRWCLVTTLWKCQSRPKFSKIFRKRSK